MKFSVLVGILTDLRENFVIEKQTENTVNVVWFNMLRKLTVTV